MENEITEFVCTGNSNGKKCGSRCIIKMCIERDGEECFIKQLPGFTKLQIQTSHAEKSKDKGVWITEPPYKK